MNKKTAFFLSLCATELLSYPLTSGGVVVGDDKPYYKHKESKNDVEVIYTKDNLPFAKQTLDVESSIHEDYRNFFDWKLDETLYVGLISDYNQIANGFSTQWPNNRQINYIGGTQLIDSFASTSWLETLLYHESAHNYQGNVKGSFVSRGLHSVLGNGSFITFLPIIVPNVMENSFMLEGNAVLNESWHGNGGRLYNGFYKAQTILQAKAGKITPAYVYNSRLAFPYGDIVYMQGAFFNLYLAEKYGIERVNSYFKYHSEDFLWPQFTNASLKKAVGVNFEESLEFFSQEYASLGEKFTQAEGETIVSSQFFSSLSNSNDEIFFIINESGVEEPQLVVFDKVSKKVKKIRDSWLRGKVIKEGSEYYVQGSANTSPTRIYQGLFDSGAFIKEQTESKMVQGYLSDGRCLYFDVTSSYSQPQLYIDGTFYAQVNSSVIIDKSDNIYYFKQNGKIRTLYRNKTPLYSYEGFYGVVSDVDSKGSVYFVANSPLGSTLYIFENGKVSRASDADNIREARLINDKEILLAAINDKEYYYIVNHIVKRDEEPYATKLFFEEENYYAKNLKKSDAKVDISQEYNAFLDMHYSGSDVSVSYDSLEGFLGSLYVEFGDPLSQNNAEIFISKDESTRTVAGLSYTNAQSRLHYSLMSYGIIDNGQREKVNKVGFIVDTTLPLYQAGYYYASLSLSYYQDYDAFTREPLSATLTLLESKSYGVSMYNNSLNMLHLYGVSDRGDKIIGGDYTFEYGLAHEFYIGTKAKYSLTDRDSQNMLRGVKLTNLPQTQSDPSTITMPSYSRSAFIKRAGYGELNLKKVLNTSAYFFTFPLSLQRESIYAKYRYYDIKDFSNNIYRVNETTFGATFATIFFNSFLFPISLEYIQNDASFTEDKEKIRIILGSTF